MSCRVPGCRWLAPLRQLGPNGWVVLLLLAVALTRGVLYALLNPPFGSPDEQAHFDYVSSLHRFGLVPPEVEESYQPPLYYWLNLPAYALVAGQPPAVELLAIRLMSVLMTAATVLLAYQTARLLCPKERLVYLGAAAFVALVPSYGWIGASANNDNLANLVVSGVVYLLVRSLSEGFTRGQSLGLLALAGAGLATKTTAWPMAGLVLAVLAGRLAAPTVARRPVATLACALLAALAVVAALAGPLRPLPEAVLRSFAVRGDFFSGGRLLRFLSNLDAWPFVYQFKTFWVTFWSDTIQPPSPFYWMLAALCAAAAAGLMVRLAAAGWAMARGETTAGGRVFLAQISVLIAAVVLQWALVMLRFYRENPLRPVDRPAGFDELFWAVQGRFLFPVMVPIGFLLVWGLAAFVPRRWAGSATVALLALLLAVDWVALATLFVGYYSWPR